RVLDPSLSQYFTEIATAWEDTPDPQDRASIAANALEEARGKEHQLLWDTQTCRTLEPLLSAAPPAAAARFLAGACCCARRKGGEGGEDAGGGGEGTGEREVNVCRDVLAHGLASRVIEAGLQNIRAWVTGESRKRGSAGLDGTGAGDDENEEQDGEGEEEEENEEGTGGQGDLPKWTGTVRVVLKKICKEVTEYPLAAMTSPACSHVLRSLLLLLACRPIHDTPAAAEGTRKARRDGAEGVGGEEKREQGGEQGGEEGRDGGAGKRFGGRLPPQIQRAAGNFPQSSGTTFPGLPGMAGQGAGLAGGKEVGAAAGGAEAAAAAERGRRVGAALGFPALLRKVVVGVTAAAAGADEAVPSAAVAWSPYGDSWALACDPSAGPLLQVSVVVLLLLMLLLVPSAAVAWSPYGDLWTLACDPSAGPLLQVLLDVIRDDAALLLSQVKGLALLPPRVQPVQPSPPVQVLLDVIRDDAALLLSQVKGLALLPPRVQPVQPSPPVQVLLDVIRDDAALLLSQVKGLALLPPRVQPVQPSPPVQVLLDVIRDDAALLTHVITSLLHLPEAALRAAAKNRKRAGPGRQEGGRGKKRSRREEEERGEEGEEGDEEEGRRRAAEGGEEGEEVEQQVEEEVGQIIELMKDRCGSRFMETVIQLAPPSLRSSLLRVALLPHLLPLALHPIANYTVQTALSALLSPTDTKRAFKALAGGGQGEGEGVGSGAGGGEAGGGEGGEGGGRGVGLLALLKGGRGRVVLALLIACGRTKTFQSRVSENCDFWSHFCESGSVVLALLKGGRVVWERGVGAAEGGQGRVVLALLIVCGRTKTFQARACDSLLAALSSSPAPSPVDAAAADAAAVGDLLWLDAWLAVRVNDVRSNRAKKQLVRIEFSKSNSFPCTRPLQACESLLAALSSSPAPSPVDTSAGDAAAVGDLLWLDAWLAVRVNDVRSNRAKKRQQQQGWGSVPVTERGAVSFVGCMALQTIFSFPLEASKRVVQACVALPPSYLMHLATDVKGTRVLSAFFRAATVPLDLKTTMLNSLKPRLTTIAADRLGAFVVSAAFDAMTVEGKQMILAELATRYSSASSSLLQRPLFRHMGLAEYLESPEAWQKQQQRKEGLMREFQDLLAPAPAAFPSLAPAPPALPSASAPDAKPRKKKREPAVEAAASAVTKKMKSGKKRRGGDEGDEGEEGRHGGSDVGSRGGGKSGGALRGIVEQLELGSEMAMLGFSGEGGEIGQEEMDGRRAAAAAVQRDAHDGLLAMCGWQGAAADDVNGVRSYTVYDARNLQAGVLSMGPVAHTTTVVIGYTAYETPNLQAGALSMEPVAYTTVIGLALTSLHFLSPFPRGSYTAYDSPNLQAGVLSMGPVAYTTVVIGLTLTLPHPIPPLPRPFPLSYAAYDSPNLHAGALSMEPVAYTAYDSPNLQAGALSMEPVAYTTVVIGLAVVVQIIGLVCFGAEADFGQGRWRMLLVGTLMGAVPCILCLALTSPSLWWLAGLFAIIANLGYGISLVGYNR
ncbi:unnamed protein product, partial [Closterium sp. Naga37s-1]